MSGPRQQSEVALEKLRRDILGGVLAPGAEVSEAGIAERYATGRASARTALQRLTQQGLVDAVPRRGYIITRMTIGDVLEIFQLRLVLEPMAARLAAGRIDARLMREREMAAVEAWHEGSSGAQALENNRFIHMQIAQASGNRRLARQIEELLGESERSILLGLGGGGAVTKMIGEHLPLIEALAAGNAELAEERARAHVETAMRNVMDVLLSRDAVLSQPIHEPRA